MLAPKKLKRRKYHRPDVRGLASGNKELAFGDYGLKAVTGGWIKATQIEAARRVISRSVKKGGKLWIRIFPHRSISAKGTQATMGGGKGVPEYYVAVVRPGTVILEMDGLPEAKAKEALELAAYKFPIKTKFIVKN
ncbi:MAG: 50S ribosomal protein L16 [Patescibacteria group bacterium]